MLFIQLYKSTTLIMVYHHSLLYFAYFLSSYIFINFCPLSEMSQNFGFHIMFPERCGGEVRGGNRKADTGRRSISSFIFPLFICYIFIYFYFLFHISSFCILYTYILYFSSFIQCRLLLRPLLTPDICHYWSNNISTWVIFHIHLRFFW